MPIYEQSYRRYEARAPLRKLRFWPITREALRMILARRAFLGLLAVAFGPFLFRVGQIYVVTRFPEAGRVLPVDGRLFGDFLSGQLVFTLLLSVFGGAGLVANDLRSGAIVVYLSRPLTRRDYVLGKLSVLVALNLTVTLLPAVVLYLVALALAPAQFLVWRLAWIGPAVVVQSLAIALSISLLALAFSALTRSARVAGLAFFGVLVGLELVRGIGYAVYRRSETALVSVQADLRALGAALFGTREGGPIPEWHFAALVLALLGLGCLWVLRRRVRAVEIVT